MSRCPTLQELRGRVQKERYREIGNWLARRVARPSAVYGTWVAVRLGVSANQVTLAALLANVAAAVSIGTGSRSGFVVGVLLAHLAFWLDHVDGQVARWNGTSSLDGVYFDYQMHHVASLCLGFALGYGLVAHTGDPSWAVPGFAIALGWTLLSLHNDCRYKAFFQRLKREHNSYRVVGGSGGKPSPPASWPKRGLSAIAWPAYKACEPHVVLGELTVMALLAVCAPWLWMMCWRFGVLAGAGAVPLLALARSSRAVARAAVETEFARWFQPTDPENSAEAPPAPKRGQSQNTRRSEAGQRLGASYDR